MWIQIKGLIQESFSIVFVYNLREQEGSQVGRYLSKMLIDIYINKYRYKGIMFLYI